MDGITLISTVQSLLRWNWLKPSNFAIDNYKKDGFPSIDTWEPILFFSLKSVLFCKSLGYFLQDIDGNAVSKLLPGNRILLRQDE